VHFSSHTFHSLQPAGGGTASRTTISNQLRRRAKVRAEDRKILIGANEKNLVPGS